MKKINKAFTLVELLVVITIIAILWVVAYTQFWGATDKAKAAAKLQDANAIVSSLSTYKSEKWFYPKVGERGTGSGNLLWYDKNEMALTWSTITWYHVDSDWQFDTAPTNWKGWWKVNDINWDQIWAKWTFSNDWAIKKYLSDDVYDRELWDIALPWNKKMIDLWIGRYIYANYKKSNSWGTVNENWTYYNIAYTTKEKDWTYKTVIKWDYNEQQCAVPWDCPSSLIWPGWASLNALKNWDKTPNLPYPISF